MKINELENILKIPCFGYCVTQRLRLSLSYHSQLKRTTMTKIQNSNDFTLNPAQQQAVNNAAANYGVDEVLVDELFEDEDEDGLFYAPVYDVDGNFLFNVNMNTNEIQ